MQYSDDLNIRQLYKTFHPVVNCNKAAKNVSIKWYDFINIINQIIMLWVNIYLKLVALHNH